jgi:hypothetical protein
MIKNEKLNMTITQGDDFDMIYAVKGLSLEENDILQFSVRGKKKGAPLLMVNHNSLDLANNKFRVTSSQISNLPPGTYYYDIILLRNGSVRTMMWTALLSIEEVAHI